MTNHLILCAYSWTMPRRIMGQLGKLSHLAVVVCLVKHVVHLILPQLVRLWDGEHQQHHYTPHSSCCEPSRAPCVRSGSPQTASGGKLTYQLNCFQEQCCRVGRPPQVAKPHLLLPMLDARVSSLGLLPNTMEASQRSCALETHTSCNQRPDFQVLPDIGSRRGYTRPESGVQA